MARSILPMPTPPERISPSDGAMAADAGFEVVSTETGVAAEAADGATPEGRIAAREAEVIPCAAA